MDGSELIFHNRRTIEAHRKIGILYICTGAYVVFWQDFHRSMEKKFCLNSSLEFFVFTDSDHIEGDEKKNVHRIFVPCKGWPYDTLFRFDIFIESEQIYTDCDYLFFFNANYICCRKVKEEEFLPSSTEKLVFTIHPGMYNKQNTEFTYERNPESLAYIPDGEGRYYIAGGLNGGKTSDYMTLVHKLSDRIHKDLDNDIIAIYHDESHINKYLYESYDSPVYKLLSPGYCYPEGWKIPYRKILMLREKDKYIDIKTIKGE